jgi:hypothetical protein
MLYYISREWKAVRDQFLMTMNSVALPLLELSVASVLTLTAVEIQQV